MHTTPSSQARISPALLWCSYAGRLGSICLIWGCVLLVLMLLAPMTAILWMLLGVLFFLLLVAVSVVTVGLVYLVFPHFYKLWSVAIGMLTSQVTEGLMRITEWLYTYAPYVSLALLCASVLFHVLDRRRGIIPHHYFFHGRCHTFGAHMGRISPCFWGLFLPLRACKILPRVNVPPHLLWLKGAVLRTDYVGSIYFAPIRRKAR